MGDGTTAGFGLVTPEALDALAMALESVTAERDGLRAALERAETERDIAVRDYDVAMAQQRKLIDDHLVFWRQRTEAAETERDAARREAAAGRALRSALSPQASHLHGREGYACSGEAVADFDAQRGAECPVCGKTCEVIARCPGGCGWAALAPEPVQSGDLGEMLARLARAEGERDTLAAELDASGAEWTYWQRKAETATSERDAALREAAAGRVLYRAAVDAFEQTPECTGADHLFAACQVYAAVVPDPAPEGEVTPGEAETADFEERARADIDRMTDWNSDEAEK